MDEAGNHHSQQTNTGTENQTWHVLTHNWELNNENTWTQGGEYHAPGPVGGWEATGWIALGEIPNVDDGLMGAANLPSKKGQYSNSGNTETTTKILLEKSNSKRDNCQIHQG